MKFFFLIYILGSRQMSNSFSRELLHYLFILKNTKLKKVMNLIIRSRNLSILIESEHKSE